MAKGSKSHPLRLSDNTLFVTFVFHGFNIVIISAKWLDCLA